MFAGEFGSAPQQLWRNILYGIPEPMERLDVPVFFIRQRVTALGLFEMPDGGILESLLQPFRHFSLHDITHCPSMAFASLPAFRGRCLRPAVETPHRASRDRHISSGARPRRRRRRTSHRWRGLSEVREPPSSLQSARTRSHRSELRLACALSPHASIARFSSPNRRLNAVASSTVRKQYRIVL